MKKEGYLKIILAMLIIVLLCLISFGGFYLKDKNIMENKIREYSLGMDLDTNTIKKLDVKKDEENSSESTQEETKTEENENSENLENTNNEENNTSNENIENQNLENETSQEESKSDIEDKDNNTQNENIYTEDNYKKSKEIIEKRLKASGIDQFTIRLDKQSGNIVIEVSNDVDSNTLQNLITVGKVEIKVADEVLGDQNSISKVVTAIDDSYVGYGMGSYIRLDIEFTNEIVNKFKEMKNNYTIPKNEDGSDAEERNVTISIDGSSICTIKESEFLSTAVNGILPLKMGDYTTDKKVLNDTLRESNNVKNILESQSLPVEYSVKYSNDIHSNISKFAIVSVFGIMVGIMVIYLLFRYKLAGLLSGTTILGFLASLLLVVRYANVQISIAGIVSIGIMLILQFVYLLNILSNKKINTKKFNEKTLEFSKMLVPAFIISVVIAFANIIEISGFGAIIFWGIILFEIFNNIITRVILTNVKNK